MALFFIEWGLSMSAQEIINELQTLGDYVRWGASRFNEAELTFGHGTDNALDEAFALVLHVLHLPPDIPAYMFETRLTSDERRAVLDILKRRVESRLPSAYLTNEAWFAGLPFFVDERVLVPRSPIAELIETSFEPWVEPALVTDVLDLCTGSGCIAIACAFAFPEARVDATDISAEALAVAERNVERHGLQEIVTLHYGDLFAGLEGRRYDIIVSNPPYVDTLDMAALSAEFRHEPELGLAAGDDGLDVVRRILAQAGDYLKPGGILVVEVGNSADALEESYPEVPFAWQEFERGGHGVFLLTAEQVASFRPVFEAAVV
jgi:ribosomal protein L3 glutamine methyltransferase